MPDHPRESGRDEEGAAGASGVSTGALAGARRSASTHDIIKVRTFIVFWLAQTLVMWLGGRIIAGAHLPTGVGDWLNDCADPWYLATIGAHSAMIAAVQGVMMLPARPPGVRGGREVPWLHHALSAVVIGCLCSGVHVAMLALNEGLNLGWDEAWPRASAVLRSGLSVVLTGFGGAGVAFGVLLVAYRERTPLGLIASICALCSAGLLGGLGYIGLSIWYVSHGDNTTDRQLSLVLSAILVMWVFGTPMIGAFLRRGTDESRLRLAARRLLIGSIVEAVSMIPLDVMVRRKSSCYCGEGTFFALLICSTVGLIALGPAIFLAPLGRRRRRLMADRCPLCGYDMSATPGAERCPECGAGWRATGARSTAARGTDSES